MSRWWNGKAETPMEKKKKESMINGGSVINTEFKNACQLTEGNIYVNVENK